MSRFVKFASLTVILITMPWATDVISAELAVRIDEAHLVRLPRASANIIVGNPSVADVTVQNSKLLIITGKSFGLTNLIVLDNESREIINTKISVKTDASRVVTLHKGAERQSYHCAPVCQSSLVIGDMKTHFEAIQKQTQGKYSTVGAALNGEQSAQ